MNDSLSFKSFFFFNSFKNSNLLGIFPKFSRKIILSYFFPLISFIKSLGFEYKITILSFKPNFSISSLAYLASNKLLNVVVM